MKKIIVLALCVLTLLTICACSGSDSVFETGKLRVAMECGYAPYNWAQETDANGAVAIKDSDMYAYGYDVIMAKKIAEANGWELEIVKLDWDGLIPALQAGTVDCVIAGQSITADRLKQVDFTEPYYYASIVTLVKKDSPYANAKSLEDLKGATAISQISTVWYDDCLPQIPEVNKLTAAADAPAMLVALNAGTCDVVVTDQPTALAACAVYDDFVMLEFEGENGFDVSEEEINIGISVQKDNKELVDAINKVLGEMTNEDYTKLMNEAIAVQPISEE
ncbi:MAG: transporter substrate-binding domain-containing protein [Clostridia bacterium]|nr:transporter substrate-binding domain-containing protein [Clostridia bacterium]